MNVPEKLYGLNPKALAGGLLELWTIQANFQQAAASLTFTSPVVPADRIVVLNSVFGMFTGGAGQSFARAFVQDIDPQNVIVATFWGGAARIGTAAVEDFVDLSPNVNYALAPGHKIQLTARYNLGGVANIVEFAVQGFMFPRGQIQLSGLGN